MLNNAGRIVCRETSGFFSLDSLAWLHFTSLYFTVRDFFVELEFLPLHFYIVITNVILTRWFRIKVCFAILLII